MFPFSDLNSALSDMVTAAPSLFLSPGGAPSSSSSSHCWPSSHLVLGHSLRFRRDLSPVQRKSSVQASQSSACAVIPRRRSPCPSSLCSQRIILLEWPEKSQMPFPGCPGSRLPVDVAIWVLSTIVSSYCDGQLKGQCCPPHGPALLQLPLTAVLLLPPSLQQGFGYPRVPGVRPRRPPS